MLTRCEGSGAVLGLCLPHEPSLDYCGTMTVYADLLRYRELFANLFRRDFQAKYKGSLLGVFWSLLNPLVLLGVYLVVFGLHLPEHEDRALPDLPARRARLLDLLLGLAAVGGALDDRQRGADQEGAVPAPARRVLDGRDAGGDVRRDGRRSSSSCRSSSCRRRARRCGRRSRSRVLFAALVAGLALLVACLNVLFRDVEHILTAALLPWFFLTPILWSIATLPEKAKQHTVLLDVLRWGNPIAPPIYAVRDALWSGSLPRLADVVYLTVAAVLALLLGALVFRRVDDRIAVEL